MFSQNNEEKKAPRTQLELVRRYTEYYDLITQAVNLLAEKKCLEASNKFKEASDGWPTIAAAYMGNGKAKESLALELPPAEANRVLEEAIECYNSAVSYAPHYIDAWEASIKLHLKLKRKDAPDISKLRRFKNERLKFINWHRAELSKYQPALFNQHDSVDAYLGCSALTDKHYECAYYYFEQAIIRRPNDYFSWCMIAELSKEPYGPYEIVDLTESVNIVNHLINFHSYSLAYALRAMMQYDQQRIDMAWNDLAKCLETIAADSLTFLGRYENKLLRIANRLSADTPDEKLADLKKYNSYFEKASKMLAKKNPAEAFSYASFALWRLHSEEKSNSLTLRLSLTYHLRCETALCMELLPIAKKDFAMAKGYSTKPHELVEKLWVFIQKQVDENNAISDFDNSVGLLTMASDEDPNNPHILIKIALLLAKAENFTMAKNYLDDARIKSKPAGFTRIELLRKNIEKQEEALKSGSAKRNFEIKFANFQTEVKEIYSQLRQKLEYTQKAIPGKLADFSLRHAFKALEATDHAASLKYCNEALRHCPVDFVALTRRARVNLEMRNLSAAVIDFNTAINLWGYIPAYWVRANYFLASGNLERARADFITCITQGIDSSINEFTVNETIVKIILDLKQSDKTNGKTGKSLAFNLFGAISEFSKTFSADSAKTILENLHLTSKKLATEAETESKEIDRNDGPRSAKENFEATIEILKVKLLTNLTDASTHHYLALSYFGLDDYETAKLHISLAIWLEAEDNIPHIYQRSRIHLAQGNICEAYHDILELNNLLMDDAKGIDLTDNYSAALKTLKDEALPIATKAYENKEYAKAKLLYVAIMMLAYDDEIENLLQNCENFLKQETQAVSAPSEAPPIIKIKSLPQPKKAPLPSLPKARERKSLTPKGQFPTEEKSSGNGLAELEAERLKKLEESRARQNLKNQQKNKKRRQKALEKRRGTDESSPEEISTDSKTTTIEAIAASNSVNTTALTNTAGITTLLGKVTPILTPAGPGYWRRFLPKKLILPADDLACKIFLYIKQLETKKQQSFNTYIVGGTVTDWMLLGYFQNLQAELAKNPNDELAKFLENPMFDRVRNNRVNIDDLDYVTELSIPDIEALAAEFKFTVLAQPRNDARSYKLAYIKIDFLCRPCLNHLEKEIEKRASGSLFMRWNNVETANQTEYSFEIKDPSYQGMLDLSQGRLRAVDGKKTYLDATKLLYMIFQETKRKFVIHEDDRRIIEEVIPILQINDAEEVNAQIKKLFSFYNIPANYQKLIDYKILDAFFSPYFTRCLTADQAWIAQQLANANEWPFPSLKRIYAIFIVSVAMQELLNEYLDDSRRKTLFTPDSFYKISSISIANRCRNVISRFALISSYFANHKDGDINHHFEQYFKPLIAGWLQQHEKVFAEGFFSSFVSGRPRPEGSQIDGLAMLINTAEEGLCLRPASPLFVDTSQETSTQAPISSPRRA